MVHHGCGWQVLTVVDGVFRRLPTVSRRSLLSSINDDDHKHIPQSTIISTQNASRCTGRYLMTDSLAAAAH